MDEDLQRQDKQHFQKLIDYNTQQSIDRENEYKQKFIKFNEQEKLKQKLYLNSLSNSSTSKN